MNVGDDFTRSIEFSIMPDGNVLEAGKISLINVSVQRVVLEAEANTTPLADDCNYLFYGVKT